ncbi:MAG: hypothetical protein ACREOQ_00825 [Gemmatimonadales bacterium]
MRFLLCALLTAAACGRADKGREASPADTTPAAPAASPAPAAAAPDTAAMAARLIGTWEAQGYDSGGTRPQGFTLAWSRSPGGGLTGQIAFRSGEKYAVKLVSLSDSSLVYESERHRSPTLRTEVVTRTEARLSGDSLSGTYEARATAGEAKVLRGRFTAVQRRLP